MSDAKRIVETETWEPDTGGRTVRRRRDSKGDPIDNMAAVFVAGEGHFATSRHFVEEDRARARVASCAPEALRLLLEFRSSATSYQASEIDALMRKAGVLE